jgi:hypothetical protein
MRSFIEKCIDGKDCDHGETSPALEHLFNIPEDSPYLNDADKKLYHTDVARLLYLDKRAKMDI